MKKDNTIWTGSLLNTIQLIISLGMHFCSNLNSLEFMYYQSSPIMVFWYDGNSQRSREVYHEMLPSREQVHFPPLETDNHFQPWGYISFYQRLVFKTWRGRRWGLPSTMTMTFQKVIKAILQTDHAESPKLIIKINQNSLSKIAKNIGENHKAKQKSFKLRTQLQCQKTSCLFSTT